MSSNKTTVELTTGITNAAYASDNNLNKETESSFNSVFEKIDSFPSGFSQNIPQVINIDVETENRNFYKTPPKRPEPKDEIASAKKKTKTHLSKFEKSNQLENASLPMKHVAKPYLRMQILGALLCASTQMSFGASAAFTGIALPAMMDPNSKEVILNKSEASLFSAVVNVGAMIGSLISCFTMAWMGQRSTFLIFLPIGIAAWLILGFAGSFWLLVVARLLEGLCIGVTTPCGHNYVVEFAHKSVRGRLFGTLVLSYQFGILFVYLIGSSTISWRNLGLVCGIIPLAIPTIGLFFLPDSPRWLAYNGRMEEAEKSMTFFRGPLFNVVPEMEEILLQVAKTRGSTSVRSQFHKLMDKSILQIFLIFVILIFASNFTGTWVMINYAVTVFESADVPINSYLSSIFSALTRVIGVGLYLILGDRIGRRPLFIIPIFVAGVSMIILGLFFYLKLKQYDIAIISFLPLISLATFKMFSCIANSILMLLRAELLPNSIRAFGVGILIFLFYLGSFLASYTYPFMVDSIGSHWTFWIYGSVSFLMGIIVVLLIPETKGKSLEELEVIFSKKSETET